MVYRAEHQEQVDAAYPKNRKQKPRALIVWRANYLNQAKGNELILDRSERPGPIVDVNYRMDTTAFIRRRSAR